MNKFYISCHWGPQKANFNLLAYCRGSPSLTVRFLSGQGREILKQNFGIGLPSWQHPLTDLNFNLGCIRQQSWLMQRSKSSGGLLFQSGAIAAFKTLLKYQFTSLETRHVCQFCDSVVYLCGKEEKQKSWYCWLTDKRGTGYTFLLGAKVGSNISWGA